MPAGGLHTDLGAAMNATRPAALEPVPPQDMEAALAAYARSRDALYPEGGLRV